MSWAFTSGPAARSSITAAQIRQHLGYRECSVTDAERFTAWLAKHVTQAECHPDRLREELLVQCRAERVEPPAQGRVDRIVGSALRLGEETLTLRVSARLDPATTEAILALIGSGILEMLDGGVAGGQPSLLGTIKEAPGSVSLETMLTEIDKLVAVRGIGLPAGLFGDVAPKVIAAWRAGAAVESPSHLRTHPVALRTALLAALLHEREREITDTLVDLLIATVHRISARAEKQCRAPGRPLAAPWCGKILVPRWGLRCGRVRGDSGGVGHG